MTTVDVGELRHGVRELLRLVERGETVEITDRGRPVALLTPIPRSDPFDRLRQSGDIDTASSDLADLPAPLESSAVELPSVVLERLRRDER